MLKVKLHKIDLNLASICVTCGSTFVIEQIEATLWEDDERVGNICRTCTEKGSQGLSHAIKEHAAKLKKKAHKLEQLATKDIHCPTWEDYQKKLEGMQVETGKAEMKGFQPQMIMSRVFLIGEGIVPKEEIGELKSEHINIFLTEENPERWPAEILHLKKYLEIEIDLFKIYEEY